MVKKLIRREIEGVRMKTAYGQKTRPKGNGWFPNENGASEPCECERIEVKASLDEDGFCRRETVGGMVRAWVVTTPWGGQPAGVRTRRNGSSCCAVVKVEQSRYKAVLVDGSGNDYLKTVCDYVHLNPVRAKLLGTEDRLLAYPRFKREMLERTETRLGEHHSGELKRESAEGKAERIIAEELKRLGWTQTDLTLRRKSDPVKLQMASRLRAETTLSVKWTAHRLHMGSWKSATTRLHEWKKRNPGGTYVNILILLKNPYFR